MWGRGSKSVSLQRFRVRRGKTGGRRRHRPSNWMHDPPTARHATHLDASLSLRNNALPPGQPARCPTKEFDALTTPCFVPVQVCFFRGLSIERNAKRSLHSRSFMGGSCRRIRRFCTKNWNPSHFTMMGREVALHIRLPAPTALPHGVKFVSPACHEAVLPSMSRRRAT